LGYTITNIPLSISTQRLGCIHGEDLHYVFGVPLFFYGNEMSSGSSILVGDGEQFGEPETDPELKLGFFVGNFTRNEVQLAQTVMQSWTNFIKTG